MSKRKPVKKTSARNWSNRSAETLPSPETDRALPNTGGPTAATGTDQNGSHSGSGADLNCRAKPADSYSDVGRSVLSAQPLPDLSPEFPMPVLTASMSDSALPADYQPFPVDCFPGPVRDFISGQARILNCDPAAVALPVLSVLAAAIGDHWIQVKKSWTEPAIVWTALIANGQTSQAAALRAASMPLLERDGASFEQQRQLMPEYERLLTRYRADVRRARQEQQDEPDRPPVPLAERTIAADWTLPAVVRLLKKQHRGLLVCANELDGWLGRSLGSGSRASLDRQVWFDLHAGQAVTVESRSDRPAIHLDPVPVSVTGSLSEELFSEKLSKASGPSGLASRLLFAFPPTRPLQWIDEDLEESVTAGYAALVERLFAAAGQPHEHRSTTTVLSPSARDCFAAFIRDLSDAQRGLDDLLFTWTTNLSGQAARLALVLHLTRCAAGDEADATVCSFASMQRGIALARWFAFKAQRVVTSLSLQAEQREDLHLLDWLRRRGGKATPRDLCRSNRRRYPTLESAINAFDRMEATGLTDWTVREPGPHGGRPTQELVAVFETAPGASESDGNSLDDTEAISSEPSGVGAGLPAGAPPTGDRYQVSSGAIVTTGNRSSHHKPRVMVGNPQFARQPR
ncbi:MAG: DUF3987 domain-containing protein [Planctomycetes bacterium]|nr:DUF3987 domain-containing protein [Planctomycetota bacterium]